MPVCATLALIKSSRDTLAAATNSHTALNLQMSTDAVVFHGRAATGSGRRALSPALPFVKVQQRLKAARNFPI